MKLKIAALTTGISIIVFSFAFAQAQYAPRNYLRAQAVGAAPNNTLREYLQEMRRSTVSKQASPPQEAAMMSDVTLQKYRPNVLQTNSPDSPPQAAVFPNNILEQYAAGGNAAFQNLNAFNLRIENEAQFGSNSVYIGSDKIGDYIKSTGGFLRILIGTTYKNAVEKMRILANGNVGIGTTNPLSQLHINENSKTTTSNGLKITGSESEVTIKNRIGSTVISTKQIGNQLIGGIDFDTKDKNNLWLTPLRIKNDGRVLITNQFCLPNGVDSEKDVCFKYACPAENGQWTLSKTTCASTPPPPTLKGAVSASINSAFSTPTYVAGVNQVRLASFKLTETTGNEDMKLLALRFDKDTNTTFDIQNMKVMVDGKQIDSTRAIIGDTEVSLEFDSSEGFSIVKKGGVIVDIYGSILSSTTNGTHTSVFDLINGKVVGANPPVVEINNTPINGQNVIISNPVTTAKPTLYLPFSNTIMNRSRQAIDDIAIIGTNNATTTLEWGATGDGVSIKTVKLTFSGLAVSPAATFTATTTIFSSTPASTFSVDLINASTSVAWASTSQTICDPGTAKSCSVTFSPNDSIPSGVRTRKVIIRVNSSNFTDNAFQDSLAIKINAAADITWSDGVTSSMNWNPVEMPMTVANIYYP